MEVRVALKGALSGHYITAEDNKVTMGLLEDLEGAGIKEALTLIESVIVDSDLPMGHNRDGLRALKPVECRAIITAISTMGQVPKNA